MHPRQILSCILAALALAATASAQVVNPTKLAWTASDHAITTRYEVGYFLGTATSPVQTASIPVASTTPVGAEYQAALPRPVLGAFTAKMKACGTAVPSGEVCSEWSNATEGFTLSPRATAGVRLVP